MVKNYVVALAVLILLLIIFKIFQTIVLARLKKIAKKTSSELDDTIIKVFQSIKPPFYFLLAFWLALKFLYIIDIVNKIINALLMIWVVLLVIRALQILINYIVKKRVGKEDSKRVIGLVGFLTKLIVWSFGLLLILSNLGVNVNSLIAGLGIGGIAVALAVQNILGDLFGSFAIYFDKPFQVGDFIVVGDEMGTVEKIGIKTTRIRSPQGEEVVISNKELTSARVHNFKKLQRRRVVLSIGVTYDTPPAKLKKIPELIKTIIEPVDMATFDRTHFKQLGDSALLFEAVYYVESQEYLKYLDINQEILLKIAEALAKERISFAFPSQTIYLEK